MASQELSDRKARILRALVQGYIETGEPVGSEAIATATSLGVSSATIRNELAALEDLGYLTQPHTSAGRAPTDLAYRFYVDTLPPRKQLRERERRAIVSFFDEALADVDDVLRGTTHLLSELTRHASLALAPGLGESTIARVELVSLPASTLLLLVFDTGAVEKRLIELPRETGEDELKRASRKVGNALERMSVTAARDAASQRAAKEAEPERSVFARVADALASVREGGESRHVFLSGAANIAAETAFRRRDTLHEILGALERQSAMLGLLRQAAESAPVSVTIGRENPVTGMWEASVVAAPYGPGSGALGTIGVVGPTRMDYAAAISAVRAVAGRLSRVVEALAG